MYSKVMIFRLVVSVLLNVTVKYVTDPTKPTSICDNWDTRHFVDVILQTQYKQFFSSKIYFPNFNFKSIRAQYKIRFLSFKLLRYLYLLLTIWKIKSQLRSTLNKIVGICFVHSKIQSFSINLRDKMSNPQNDMVMSYEIFVTRLFAKLIRYYLPIISGTLSHLIVSNVMQFHFQFEKKKCKYYMTRNIMFHWPFITQWDKPRRRYIYLMHISFHIFCRTMSDIFHCIF